jgi:hypothetical protein
MLYQEKSGNPGSDPILWFYVCMGYKDVALTDYIFRLFYEQFSLALSTFGVLFDCFNRNQSDDRFFNVILKFT